MSLKCNPFTCKNAQMTKKQQQQKKKTKKNKKKKQNKTKQNLNNNLQQQQNPRSQFIKHTVLENKQHQKCTTQKLIF